MKLNKIESEIVKKIESYNDISLFFHSHPDFDALCSCFAIKEFINSKYPKKRIYIARFNSLDQEITQGFFPKQKNKPHNFLRNSLGIICDTANSERVAAQEYKNCKELIRFDHHPYTEKFANIEYVDDKSSACCELIAIFLINWDKSKITKTCAEYLYTGILTDTNRFMYTSTTPCTMRVCEELLKFNINRQRIYDCLYVKTYKVAAFNNYLFSIAKFALNRKIGYIVLPKDSFKKYGVSRNTPLVHILSGIKEIKIWFTLYWDVDFNRWKGSIRSRDIVVNDVAKKFGGGGHNFAAGFVLNDLEKNKSLIKELSKKLK